jgi:hypothetical protein
VLHIWGVFHYTDEFHTPHRYGFGFTIDKQGGQLKLIQTSPGTEGYNYAD